MSLPSSNSDWLEKTLESTRRDVRQLEIDACRIRTDLAQLEAANAAGIIHTDIAAPADELPGSFAEQATLRIVSLAPTHGLTDSERAAPGATPNDALDWHPAATTLPEGMEILVGAPAHIKPPSEPEIPQQIESAPLAADLSSVSWLINRSRGMYRRATSPVMASLVLHGVIVFLAVSITVATIERNDPRFLTTTLDLGEDQRKESENFDLKQLADLGDAGVQNKVADSPEFDAIGPENQKPIPIDFHSVEGAASLGQLGSFNALNTDLGALLTGAGGLNPEGNGAATGLGSGNLRGAGGGARAGGGRNGGRLESTLFFGTEAKGDRFVFVVDNSSSMKGGRLEMAEAELVKTVEGLSPRQSFYVIFVSDKTYPMFYPQREPSLVPATPANKKRLAEWVPKAILASGKNRELITAMDMAAALGPQAVYLLWDGDMRYSEKVRLDVITHLTQPNQWNFVVHTLGMGITSLDSEQNLRTIAQAHHGIFRRVDVPTARAR